MSFLLAYQLRLKNNEDQVVTVNISDTLSGVGTTVFTQLTATSIERKIVDDNEDKFSIIKGQRIEFSFVSTPTENLTTFISSSDSRWLVEGFVNSTQFFVGYLVTDATREAFLPSGTYVVKLTASDNLGLLKEIPLTKPDGTNPRGYFKLIEYVSWALRKTGFDLPINIVYNLLPEGFVLGDHTFDKVYQHAKTYEADFNESVDCYQVLEQILFGCFLFYNAGEWWIVRVDELNGSNLRTYHYTFDGTLTGNSTINPSLNVGKADNIKFISKDAEVAPKRPAKYVKPSFKFEFPREIVDNQDFSRGITWVSIWVVDMQFYIFTYANLGSFPAVGSFDATYKSTATGLYYKWVGSYVQISGAEIPQGFAYNIEDWTLERQGGGSNTIAAFVIKIRQFGDEKARYVELSPGGNIHQLKSNRVPVGIYDKFTFSVDRRLTVNETGSGTSTVTFAQIRLFGENGTYWTLSNIPNNTTEPPGTWVQSNSGFTTNNRYIVAQYVRNQVKTRDWMSAGVDANPVPVSGEIEILLIQGSNQGTHFSNLQFQYIPFIAGSYQKFTGQYHKVSQTIDTKQKVEQQVFMADAPKKLFKHALHLKTGGGQYYLTTAWYNLNATTTGELGFAKFGKYQAFELWNQYRRVYRQFEGTMMGLGTSLPGLLSLYVLTAVNGHTTNKKYMLLSYSQNLDTCEWSGTLSEVYDTVLGKDYAADHEFKYTTDNDQ